MQTAGSTSASQYSVAAHSQSSPGPPQVLQSSLGSQVPSPQKFGHTPQSASHVAQSSVVEQQVSPQLSSGQLSPGHSHGFSPGSQVPSLLQMSRQMPPGAQVTHGQSARQVSQFSPCPASQASLPQALQTPPGRQIAGGVQKQSARQVSQSSVGSHTPSPQPPTHSPDGSQVWPGKVHSQSSPGPPQVLQSSPTISSQVPSPQT